MTKDARPAIRPFRAEDAAQIIPMAEALALAVGDPVPATGAADLARDGIGPDRWFDILVAEQGMALLGYMVYCRGFEAHTGRRRFWIGDLYVEPSARRQGIARAFMAAIARQALLFQCDVYWELWRANAAGSAFYRSLGAQSSEDIAVMCLRERDLAVLAAAGAGGV